MRVTNRSGYRTGVEFKSGEPNRKRYLLTATTKGDWNKSYSAKIVISNHRQRLGATHLNLRAYTLIVEEGAPKAFLDDLESQCKLVCRGVIEIDSIRLEWNHNRWQTK